VKWCGFASVLICEYIAFELTHNCVSRVRVKMAAQVLILIFIHHMLFFIGRFVVLNANFNNISVISWWLVLLVVKPVYLQNTTNLSQDSDKLDHMLYRVNFSMSGIRNHKCSGGRY